MRARRRYLVEYQVVGTETAEVMAWSKADAIQRVKGHRGDGDIFHLIDDCDCEYKPVGFDIHNDARHMNWKAYRQ